MRSRWPLYSGLSLLILLLAGRPAGAQDNYEVGPEDILAISVLAQPGMTGDFTIDRDGMLTFPALGKIKASGMTATEFERKLTTLLADGYVKRPQLSVTVKEYKSQRVLVTGAIPKPGPYALKGDRSVRAFLGDLGNLGPDAGHEIIVTRPPAVLPVDGSEPRPALGEIPTDVDAGLLQQAPAQVPGAQLFTLSLQKAMAGDPEHNILLQAGDTIFFPKARQIYISGQVGRAGPYRYQEGMTILQALTLAGGVGPRGAAGRVKIVRIVDGEKREIKPKPTDTVQPEDTIVVPERFF
jgi:polysaccharide export outer membrane protein